MIGGIAAGIVVFNAEKERLENNISRLKKQVKDVYIFDNSNVSDGDYDGVTYLSENKNCGIAYALNRIMEQAKADGYKWLITMDQDSLIPDGMVHGFEESMREYQCWYKEKNETPSPITTALKRVMNKITVAKCRKYLRIERFDIVHVNALTAYVVGKAAILENIPVVWHIREFMEEDLGISFVSREYSLELLNRATQFIAISQPICNKWSAQLQAPVTVVHDGVPVKDYYVDNNTVHETVKVLLYGRVVPGKGQLFYVQAAENILRNTSKPCTFYFAGKVEDEEYFNSCMQSIRQSGQENSIKYLGQISDIQNLLRDTDIVCVCSTKEGFGRVTVESMLGKCLVVGAASGATTELIQDGVNGILYQPDDEADFCKKLTACIEQFDKYAGVVENGQKYALSHFTDEKNTEGILLVYKNIAERIR